MSNFRTAFKGLVNGNNETDREETANIDILPVEDTASEENIVLMEDSTSVEDTILQEITTPAETTIITTATTINGPVISEGNIIVRGHIKGDIECINLRISGKVEGNISCVSAELDACTVIGDITAKEKITIKSETTLCGNLVAEDMEINGKVKGNIDVQNTISILEHASILGDVSAASIDMDKGAIIQGQIEICVNDQQRLCFDEI
ncbi:MAG: bactofilin family protein [Eubacteriales bacterium]